MTKAELIAALAAYPDDMPVLVQGYEYGFDWPNVYESRCEFRPCNDPYAGEFYDDDKGQKVIIIGRGHSSENGIKG